MGDPGGAVHRFHRHIPECGSPEFGVDSVLDLAGTYLRPVCLAAPMNHGYLPGTPCGIPVARQLLHYSNDTSHKLCTGNAPHRFRLLSTP